MITNKQCKPQELGQIKILLNQEEEVEAGKLDKVGVVRYFD